MEIDHGKTLEGNESPLLAKEQRQELILTRKDINPDALLDDVEVAALLNCSVQQLRVGRRNGKKLVRRNGKTEVLSLDLPPHVVLFNRMIRYRYGDILEWLKEKGRQY